MDLIHEFLLDRKNALMSLNEEKIRTFFSKYNEAMKLPDDPHKFWASVHMAITGAKDLPIEFRKQSKQWLFQAGFRSMDDGEL